MVGASLHTKASSTTQHKFTVGQSINSILQISESRDKDMAAVKDRLDQAIATKDARKLKVIFSEMSDIRQLCEQTNHTPTQLLPWATLAQDINSMKSCLEQGASITPEVESNAQITGGLETYRLLVPAGLDVNRDLGWSGTALTGAITNNDQNLVSYLLEAGANPNIGSLNGTCALELAISDTLPVSMVKQLIDHGAEFPTKGLILLATLAGDTEMVKFLAENGANVNETTNDSFVTQYRGKKFSALHLVAQEGDGFENAPDMVRILLTCGADRRAKDAEGKTALELARESGQDALVTLLQ